MKKKRRKKIKKRILREQTIVFVYSFAQKLDTQSKNNLFIHNLLSQCDIYIYNKYLDYLEIINCYLINKFLI